MVTSESGHADLTNTASTESESMRRLSSTKTRIGISSVVTAILVLTSASVAFASEPPTDRAAEEASTVVSDALGEVTEAAGAGAPILASARTDLGYVAVGSASVVEVAMRPDEGVEILLPENDLSLSVTLPNLEGMENASKAEDGTITFSSAEDTMVAVQALDGGVRLMTIMEGASAPTEFDYELGLPAGAVLDEREDGSIAIFAPVKTEVFLPGEEERVEEAVQAILGPENLSLDDIATLTDKQLDLLAAIPEAQTEVHTESSEIATIGTPWAVDAAGVQLETRYTVEGGVLT